MYVTAIKITNTFAIPDWAELVKRNSPCSVQFLYALSCFNRSNWFSSKCTCITVSTFTLENVFLKNPCLPGLKSWAWGFLSPDQNLLNIKVWRFSLSHFDGCCPAQGQPAISNPAVIVGFLLFPLQCRINVSFCGLFLQNSPGTQTILFWWALHVLFKVITLTSLISDEISCAYFVLFMSLILLLGFLPFFFQSAVFQMKRHSSYITLKTKGETLGTCILSNLVEYTAVSSNSLSRAHPGFVSQFKWAVAQHAADTKNASSSWKRYVALRGVY